MCPRFKVDERVELVAVNHKHGDGDDATGGKQTLLVDESAVQRKKIFAPPRNGIIRSKSEPQESANEKKEHPLQ